MRTLRQELRRWLVSRWMVKVNGIAPELAAYHVCQMNEGELSERVRMYMKGNHFEHLGRKRRAVA